jgi:hypothetical protein
MPETVIKVPANAGTSEQWGELVVLGGPTAETVVLNLADLQSVDPLFLLRLRGFIDWHCSDGRQVHVIRPDSPDICNYLVTMGLNSDLPDGCHCDFGAVRHIERSEVLIPIRQLRSSIDSDALDNELGALYSAHFSGRLGRLAEAFTRTVSEMCDNATSHGRSQVGVAYVTAQRYTDKSCVLAIGDLGIGIPDHIRKAFPGLANDDDAIRVATKEGVTATGNPHRGIGYQYVIDGLKETQVPKGELRIWSGQGRFRIEVRDGIQVRRRAWAVDHSTVGAWVRLELWAE